MRPEEKVSQTRIKEAIESYLKVAKANLLANKTDETTYWREMPGHLRTLERWGKFAGLNRQVITLTRDDFVFWIAAETERGKSNGRPLKNRQSDEVLTQSKPRLIMRLAHFRI